MQISRCSILVYFQQTFCLLFLIFILYSLVFTAQVQGCMLGKPKKIVESIDLVSLQILQKVMQQYLHYLTKCSNICFIWMECSNTCFIWMECTNIFFFWVERTNICFIWMECTNTCFICIECTKICFICLECTNICFNWIE